MSTILITGITGNVGRSIVSSLDNTANEFTILGGVRNVQKSYDFLENANIKPIHFDFEDVESISKALIQTDILFLLRPPHISDAKKYFQPILDEAKTKNVKHVVFLSVQGAETSSMIPHHKIEKIILESGIDYTFLRPAYFMQNFTTTLREDIIENKLIYLPAGTAKFTIVDLEDVGKVGASVLTNTNEHKKKAYDLTNQEQLTFGQMADQISEVTGEKIQFKSPNLLAFFIRKKKEKVPTMLILVMIMLHYLPRFSKTPKTSEEVLNITGDEPNSFKTFITQHKKTLVSI